jgi:MGT family glycosyltransferase
MSLALFFGTPEWGHTNPSLSLVAELVRRGEQVIYYSLEEFQSAIEQTGASFRSYGDALPAVYTQGNENGFQVVRQLLQASECIVDQFRKDVEDIHPDYILYDSLAAWGHYFAQLLHVPAICSMTMFGITWRLAYSVPSLVWMALLSYPELIQAERIGRRISKKYAVKRLDSMSYLRNHAQLNIVYTSRFFQPYASAFDETFQFVGPSLGERPVVADFPFEQISDPAPIYISLGTIFNQQYDFYQQCLQAFADSDHQVILSIGRDTSIEQLATIPKNFIVRRFVPQLDILQRASLFITHGGMNSTSEALYYGVPLLVIPQATDQHYVAKRVAQLGAGLQLERKKVTAALLSHTATTILNNAHFAQSSKSIGVSLRQAGGYMRAADEVQLFKERYGIV